MEEEFMFTLPDWYKGFLLSKCYEFNKILPKDRPIEYIYFALKQRPFLLNMINNNIKFCMEDPEVNMRILYNCIADILKKFKQL